MAFSTNIVNVNISLATTPVTVAGFGTPIFASEHRWFPERVRSYSSITEVGVDIPTDSPEYAAALGFFSADASPDLIKIGRRKVDSVTVNPDTVTGTAGQVFSLNVTGTDSVEVTATYTTSGGDTATEVTAALVGQLGGVAGVTVTDLTGTFSIAATVPTVDNYSIGSLVALEAAYTTTETAADMLVEIENVDTEWYFMTSNDHSAGFISTATTGMADAIEAREKLYLFSSQAVESLVTYDDTVTSTSPDVLGFMKVDQKFRTAGVFHHEADTTFPECYYISRFAPKNPGETVWTTKNIKVSVSKDPSTGYNLNTTQLGNLADRNANFIQLQGGIAVVRQGLTAGGERIEVMRFRDFLVARITEAYQLDAINKEKTPYTDSGINSKRSVLESVLSRYVTTADQPRGLQEAPAFTTTFPRRVDVDPSDVIAGVLNASFIGYLSGAIIITNIDGTLTYEGLIA
tara:strand:- start:1237 stop:2619 length:1383 start_codon:yes stop_codon:yes gene_type:complete